MDSSSNSFTNPLKIAVRDPEQSLSSDAYVRNSRPLAALRCKGDGAANDAPNASSKDANDSEDIDISDSAPKISISNSSSKLHSKFSSYTGFNPNYDLLDSFNSNSNYNNSSSSESSDQEENFDNLVRRRRISSDLSNSNINPDSRRGSLALLNNNHTANTPTPTPTPATATATATAITTVNKQAIPNKYNMNILNQNKRKFYALENYNSSNININNPFSLNNSNNSNNNDSFEDALMSLSDNDSSSNQQQRPNIVFRNFVSKSNLKPQLKSFRRITRELQSESHPLDNEIKHEAAVTFTLRDEDYILKNYNNLKNNISQQKKQKNIFSNITSSTSISKLSHDKNYLMNYNEESLRKNQLITKVNEAWNTKNKKLMLSLNNQLANNYINPTTPTTPTTPSSSSSIEHSKLSNSFDNPVTPKHNTISKFFINDTNHNQSSKKLNPENLSIDTSSPTLAKIETPRNQILKRKLNDDYYSNNKGISYNKRRAVSTSPILTTGSSPSSLISKRGFKLVQSTSDDLEKMSLKD
ncbi:uncharacterized protein ASCRUDRAFT_75840 [Ascoidea rubescens DSM 1968]|uniref:Uncharacterized protein n=1 Tax=Ascoidea rubescens DSM 1968 TaxID=1344418 RepID=A0A1D2VHL5_9ASCO|nr:hypothetical protein ASCRUDRAFT_75840 [Ascoidea rubescens DSM 1968]ODV61115.1 hypothetical protein ASCRUDRAFT_75840 [Ascoidea rubescens DSM 1968]